MQLLPKAIIVVSASIALISPTGVAPVVPEPGWGTVENDLVLQEDGSCVGGIVLTYRLKSVDVEGRLVADANETCVISARYETTATAQPLSPTGNVWAKTANPLMYGSPWVTASIQYVAGCPLIVQIDHSEDEWMESGR